MADTTDFQLLRQYAQEGSEEAFKTLVDRHVNLVYSVAVARLGNEAAAKDITQVVFAALADKASRLSEKVILSGWLFQVTTHACQDLIRAETRRKKRENEAVQQQITESNPAHPETNEIAPMISGALASLGASERDAILLRFLEERDFRQVGAQLGISEAAAKMRVARGLERLRQLLQKRGVAVSEATLCGAFPLMIHSAPVGLGSTIKAGAAVHTALSPSNTALLKGVLKTMAWTKMKVAVILGAGVLLAAGGGTALYALHKSPGKPSHGEEEYFPRSSWASSGFATPEASLKSALWAKSIGDVKGFQAAQTPDMGRDLGEALFKNKTESEKSAIVIASIKDIKGFRMRNKTILPDGQINMELRFDGLPETTYELMTMTNIAGEWKFAMVEEHSTASFFRWPALKDEEFAPRAGSDLQGSWKGVVTTRNGVLHVNLRIAEPYKDKFRADVFRIDQESFRLAAEVSYDGKTVKVTPTQVYGMFQGKLRNGGAEMIGNWIQNGREMPATFTRAK